jgi:guanidinobutyrase
MWTAAAPFDSLRIDDLGDIATNPFDLLDSIERVYQGLRLIAEAEVRPVILGGDHTLSLGVLRALAETQGPIGVLHVDAHTDINDRQFGVSITHGTWFRRACEEGLIDRSRSAQIGVRATGYSATDFDWSRSEGIQVIQAERCWHQSLTPLMGEIRERMKGGPVYLSFDIDAIDPAYAPATGTPEPGGLTSIQAIEIVRGLYGLDLIGADIVEVCPPYDHGGITALLAANLAFEVLCVLPGVEHTKS